MGCNKSVIAERTTSELVSRRDTDEANFLAFNLVHGIVMRIRSAAQQYSVGGHEAEKTHLLLAGDAISGAAHR